MGTMKGRLLLRKKKLPKGVRDVRTGLIQVLSFVPVRERSQIGFAREFADAF
jgi:hypothetical protein